MATPRFDTSVNVAIAGAPTTQTITVAAHDNPLLIGLVWHTVETETASVSSNLNGAFTLLSGATDSINIGGTTYRLKLFYKVAPSSGSHTITFSSTGSVAIGGAVESWYDVDPTTPLSASSATHGTTSPASATVTSTPTDMVIDWAYLVSDDRAISTPSRDGWPIAVQLSSTEVFDGTYVAGTGSNVTPSWTLLGTIPGWIQITAAIRLSPAWVVAPSYTFPRLPMRDVVNPYRES
jgi:hypothetical protein